MSIILHITSFFQFTKIPIPPLLAPLVWFATGILVAHSWFTAAGIFFPLFCLALPIFCATSRNTRKKTVFYTVFLGSSFFLAGFCCANFQKNYHSEKIKKIFEGNFLAKGVICEIRQKPQKTSQYEYLVNSQLGYVIVTCCVLHGEQNLKVGDQVTIPRSKYSATKNPSKILAYMRDGIIATTHIGAKKIMLRNRPKWSFLRKISEARATMRNKLCATCKPPINALLISLFLGDRSLLILEAEHLYARYAQWGISHHLARSGLHLVMIIFIWQLLISILPLSIRARQITIAFFCILYSALSFTSVSFNRALIMALCATFCALSKRQTTSLALTTTAAWIILATNPVQLLFLDFQLSFLLTFTLGWMNELSMQRRQKY